MAHHALVGDLNQRKLFECNDPVSWFIVNKKCFTSHETFFFVYFCCFSQPSSADWISRSCHMTCIMWHKLEHDQGSSCPMSLFNAGFPLCIVYVDWRRLWERQLKYTERKTVSLEVKHLFINTANYYMIFLGLFLLISMDLDAVKVIYMGICWQCYVLPRLCLPREVYIPSMTLWGRRWGCGRQEVARSYSWGSDKRHWPLQMAATPANQPMKTLYAIPCWRRKLVKISIFLQM